MEQKSMKDLQDTPTADLLAEWGLQKAAQPFAYPNKYYFIICETCGWKGSSEECGEHLYGDDSEAYCGNCGNTKLKDDIEFDAVRFAAISAELDRRCSEAGITIYENQFIYTKADAWTALDRVAEEYIALAVDLPAIEQQALQEWVLMKEGKRA